jgi:hypothetical protein
VDVAGRCQPGTGATAVPDPLDRVVGGVDEGGDVLRGPEQCGVGEHVAAHPSDVFQEDRPDMVFVLGWEGDANQARIPERN